ncbi:2-dehydro-3-deoxygalactonokinase [Membranicola marinus]|uniref:2-dehydro-3-deoxygalactonokinase n=1 Tax=Membranihabitans marinus TaxID=1227546 RepID=A0A953LD70_9BACT|nr:2-dehydro-3-deoxygalactonokinase [Membranihabitans marinus]MBY5960251.1 2-dehydro-3-deoxygalactonokinase [Membranihabitans marinus]
MGNYILCCDWGTTSLRLRLVDKQTREMNHEVRSNLGISNVFDMWKNKVHSSDQSRVSFYLESLVPAIKELEEKSQISLTGIPIIISGMASSTIGLKELPYASVPVEIKGNAIITEAISEMAGFRHKVCLISGIRTSNDVMRGEEVQLLGMEGLLKSFQDDELLVILPGTHSKHVKIKSGKIIDFSTYVTGELFALMSQNGLLKEAVKASRISDNSLHWTHFIEGVKYSGQFSLLQGLFKVRTNDLFQRNNKEQNYFFLSGLLIGYELRSIQEEQGKRLVLCCQNGLFDYYKKAIDILDMTHDIYLTAPEDVDRFTIYGQLKIYEAEVRNT